MLDRPDLSDEQIHVCLLDTYGLHTTAIEFLPLGYDVHAGVYRVRDADGHDYFLKVRHDTVYEPGIHVARYLKAQGMSQVVAPLPTINGALFGQIESFAALLYPFVPGESGMDAGLTDAQWVAYGAALRTIHETRLPDELARTLSTETFVPHEPALRVLRQYQQRVEQEQFDDPLQQQLATFWLNHHAAIRHIIEQTEWLGQRLQAHKLHFVLCHADIHTNNLLLTPAGDLYIVDWDQPMLAPTARDLMFILDRGIGFGPDERQEALFFEGYGAAEVDPMALAYYRYEWLVQDLGSFAEMVFLRHDVSEATRQDSARLFMVQFAAGNLADIARKLDNVI